MDTQQQKNDEIVKAFNVLEAAGYKIIAPACESCGGNGFVTKAWASLFPHMSGGIGQEPCPKGCMLRMTYNG